MKQNAIVASNAPVVTLADVQGDLQVAGWEREEVAAKSDGEELDLRADYQPFTEDKFAQIKQEYRMAGELDALRDNTAYGYIAKRTA